MANFSTELKDISALHRRFYNFKILYRPRSQNAIADSLIRTKRSFHMDFFLLFYFSQATQTIFLCYRMTFLCKQKSSVIRGNEFY